MVIYTIILLMSTQENIQRAKQLLEESDALFITAGAGMGVDSGLHDFRGVEDETGEYPSKSVNGKVMTRLQELYEG
jgi:NAD-dependent SIR2 family protein deacetylase